MLQEHSYTVSEDEIKKKKIKKKNKIKNTEETNGETTEIRSSQRDKMSFMKIRLNDITQEPGSSSWFTVFPIKRLGFNLSKSDFWDAVRLRYKLPLKRLSSPCGCQKHAISRRKGGFITLRHNELRDNTAEMLEEVSREPALQPLSGEIKGSQSDKVRSDISTIRFWIRGQRAFFDNTAFDPNAQRHQSKTLRKCYKINEQENRENTVHDF